MSNAMPSSPPASVLHLASGNSHKVVEFQELARCSGLAVTIRSARDAGGMPDVEEDTGTFAGNARKKAQALKAKLGAEAWVLADDSGLCVDALGGAPGVESAYYAGPQGDAAANLEKLIRVMAEVPAGRRGAYFVCVLVLLGASGAEHVFEGRCEGTLAQSPRAGGGFGYDPLFVPDGSSLTFAEMEEDGKNRLSHRARAWEKLAQWLRAERECRSGFTPRP
jgi:XTP/dITP diphosphohydrolase